MAICIISILYNYTGIINEPAKAVALAEELITVPIRKHMPGMCGACIATMKKKKLIPILKVMYCATFGRIRIILYRKNDGRLRQKI